MTAKEKLLDKFRENSYSVFMDMIDSAKGSDKEEYASPPIREVRSGDSGLRGGCRNGIRKVALEPEC